MSSAQKIIQAAAGNVDTGVEPVGIDFDGTNDSLSRSSDLTGNADSKTFTFSCYFYLNQVSSTQAIYRCEERVTNASFEVFYSSSGYFSLQARNASDTRILRLKTSPPAFNPVANTWYHFLVSVDLSNASKRHIYVNDLDISPSWDFYTDDTIVFNNTSHGIGALHTGAVPLDGRLAGVYLDYTYRDLSVEANRRDFIDENGLYVKPPTSGIISVPMDDPADPGRNDGTGGDFTLNGIVAQSGRGPDQYNAAASELDGSNDYLTNTTPSGPTAATQFTFSCNYRLNTANTEYLLSFDLDNSWHNFSVRVKPSEIRFESYYTNSSSAKIAFFTASTGDPLTLTGKNVSLQIQVDMSDQTKTKVLLNGEELTVSVTAFDTSRSFDFSKRAAVFALAHETFANFAGVCGEMYLDTSYIDLSSDNPFYDTETGKPKYLGENGELPTGSSPLIYLPMRADDAGNNLGTGGDFTVNSGPYDGARGPSEYWASAAEFNGSNQQLSRTSAISGIADGKTFSMVMSLRPDTISGFGYIFDIAITGTNQRFYIIRAGDDLTVDAINASGAKILDLATTGDIFSAGSWVNIQMCFDLSDPAKRFIYVNGAEVGVSYTNYTNDNIRFSEDAVGIGASGNGTQVPFDGKIGFMWFNTEYIDFSQEANRLKFFDAFNNPVDLGEDGSTPTGSQPLIYLNEGFHLGTNLGSGGDFTPVNSPTDGGNVKG